MTTKKKRANTMRDIVGTILDGVVYLSAIVISIAILLPTVFIGVIGGIAIFSIILSNGIEKVPLATALLTCGAWVFIAYILGKK